MSLTDCSIVFWHGYPSLTDCSNMVIWVLDWSNMVIWVSDCSSMVIWASQTAPAWLWVSDWSRMVIWVSQTAPEWLSESHILLQHGFRYLIWQIHLTLTCYVSILCHSFCIVCSLRYLNEYTFRSSSNEINMWYGYYHGNQYINIRQQHRTPFKRPDIPVNMSLITVFWRLNFSCEVPGKSEYSNVICLRGYYRDFRTFKNQTCGRCYFEGVIPIIPPSSKVSFPLYLPLVIPYYLPLLYCHSPKVARVTHKIPYIVIYKKRRV